MDDDDDLVAIDLTDDERTLMVQGLNEYGGARARRAFAGPLDGPFDGPRVLRTDVAVERDHLSQGAAVRPRLGPRTASDRNFLGQRGSRIRSGFRNKHP
jgi:hypothetical protein